MNDHFPDPYGPDPELYDQDAHDMSEYDRWRDEIAARPSALQRFSKAVLGAALEQELFLRWEHELSQPNYYDYYLEEMTR